MAEFTLVVGNRNYSSWSLRGFLAARLAGIAFEEHDPTSGREPTGLSIADIVAGRPS